MTSNPLRIVGVAGQAGFATSQSKVPSLSLKLDDGRVITVAGLTLGECMRLVGLSGAKAYVQIGGAA